MGSMVGLEDRPLEVRGLLQADQVNNLEEIILALISHILRINFVRIKKMFARKSSLKYVKFVLSLLCLTVRFSQFTVQFKADVDVDVEASMY